MAGDIQAEYRALFGPGEGDFAGVAAKLRLVRDGNVITPDATITSLRREKDDVTEVAKGYECGMVLSYPDIQVGDEIQAYEMVEVPRT